MWKKIFNITNLAILAVFSFIVSILPVLYLSFFNRATGDDLGYGAATRQAWVTTGRLTDVVNALIETVREYYYGWQGTWFSVALFTLQPEVFSEKAYVIVTFLTVTLWILVTAWLLHLIMVRKMSMTKSGFVLTATLFLAVNIHFVPTTRPSLFWYNGIVHYQLPYLFCLLLLGLLIKYISAYKWRDLIFIALLAFVLGGGNYQAALFSLLVMTLFLAGAYICQRKHQQKEKILLKKPLLLLLPISIESVGLIISMRAPGNKVRGGADFGFSLSRAAASIYKSFLACFSDIGEYLREKPLAIIILLLMLLTIFFSRFASEADYRNNRAKASYPLPGLFLLITFCVYAAMQTPEIYSGSWVSGGPGNFNFFMFNLLVLANGWYFSSWLCITKKYAPTRAMVRILLGTAIVCFLLVPVFRGNVRTTAFWKCVEYIASGAANEYREQMDQQTAILLDENIKDVVLPFMNDFQGPLMCMPAIDDPDGFGNSVIKKFYNKDSVIAMERTEWNAIYGFTAPPGP